MNSITARFKKLVVFEMSGKKIGAFGRVLSIFTAWLIGSLSFHKSFLWNDKTKTGESGGTM